MYKHWGYSDDYDEGSSEWGKGSPLKIGLTLVWDDICYWRFVPHKHLRSSYDDPRDPMESEKVNSQCRRCYRWFNIKSGKLDNRFNKKGSRHA